MLVTFGKMQNWKFIAHNTEFVAVTLNWVLIFPIIITFLLMMLGNIVRGMSSV